MPDQPSTPRWPHGPTRFELRFGNATTRVAAAIVAIPIVIGAIWLGGWAFFAFVAIISTGALMEFYWLAEKKGAAPLKWLGVIAGILFALAFMFPLWPESVARCLMMRLAGVFASNMVVVESAVTTSLVPAIVIQGTLMVAVVAALIAAMARRDGSALLNVTATLAGVVYVSMFLATLVGLRIMLSMYTIDMLRPQGNVVLHGEPLGAYLVAAVIVTIWICDSGAYYCGRAFGRHKLFERVSPKKTWEGAIGGAICAVAAVIGMQCWFLDFLRLGDAIAIGLIVGIFGQVGDLAQSLLKRDAGVKDSSYLIPGHGGLFDRFDSLLFVAPLVYLYMLLVYSPPWVADTLLKR